MAELLLAFPNAQDLLPRAQPIDFKLFPDGESYVRIPTDVAGKDVLLAERCWPEQDACLIRLFLAVCQLRAMGARRIRCLVPYLPYARQDKRFLEGEAVSAQTICRLLRLMGCDELITFDCHFLKKEGTFTFAGLRIHNISLARPLLALLKPKASRPLIVSPDVGAAYMVEGEKEKGVMKKVRGGYGRGRRAYRRIARMEARIDVRGRDVILIDDMISTGSTMVKAVRALRRAGARRVLCAASHGLFLSGSLRRLRVAGAADVVVSDSIPSPASRLRLREVWSP
ncbi:MAG: ribose-phosphate diphosphokinase [Candidatus Micrarchaeia archaeon]